MKINRLLLVSVTTVMLLAFTFASPPSSSVAHPAAPSTAQATVTTTPSGCDGWQLDTPYPVPVMGNAVVSLGGYIYSFGGSAGSSPGSAAYKFDGTSWTAIASLPISLIFASAVSDGANIYIVNGRAMTDTTTYVSNSLYRYSPTTDTYTELTPSRFDTALNASAYLNGKIYRIGGLSSSGHAPAYQTISTVEIYDIGTSTWDTGSNYPLLVSDEVAVARNAYIYVAGGVLDNGSYTNKTYRYDTTTNLWEDDPIADLPSARFDAVAGVLNNKWTIAGPSNSNQGTLQWDEGTNTWTQGAAIIQPVLLAGGAVLNNYLYVVGGTVNNSGITTTQRYNNSCPAPTGTPPSPTPTGTPNCERWQQQPAYPEVVSANAVASDNSYIYSFGGLSYVGYAQHSYKYDGHHWRQIADLPTLVSDASVVADGQYIYIINGDVPSNISDAIYRYDPAANSYITLTHALFPTGAQGAAYLNNKIYIIGGNTSSQRNEYTSTVQVYDIANNTWSRAASYPTVSILAQAVVINGYIYAADGTGQSTKTYRYDPQADTWDDAAVADLPLGQSTMATGLLNGQWLLISGYTSYIWNAATNTWRLLPDTLVPREWAGGGTLGNAFFLIGGFYHNSGGNVTYGSTDNQRFTSECPIPTPQPSPTTCPVPFIDINHNVFYNAIAYLYCGGAVSGADATHYAPAATSTRGQFARVIVLGFGIPIVTPAGGAQSFTDVRPSYYAYSYIESGLAAGILSGYDTATCNSYNAAFPCYRPNRPITRAELTKLVVKAAGFTPFTPTQPSFTDVGPSNVFFVSIETAHNKGVINGYPDNTFRPNHAIRRDEMAEVVYKGVTTPLGYPLALPQQ